MIICRNFLVGLWFLVRTVKQIVPTLFSSMEPRIKGTSSSCSSPCSWWTCITSHFSFRMSLRSFFFFKPQLMFYFPNLSIVLTPCWPHLLLPKSPAWVMEGIICHPNTTSRQQLASFLSLTHLVVISWDGAQEWYLKDWVANWTKALASQDGK